MADAKRCDICNELYRKNASNSLTLQVEGWEPIDLCNKCTELLDIRRPSSSSVPWEIEELRNCFLRSFRATITLKLQFAKEGKTIGKEISEA